MADTGRRCAAHLATLLAGAALRQGVPPDRFLIPIAWQATGMEPCRSALCRARRDGRRGGADAVVPARLSGRRFPRLRPLRHRLWRDSQAEADHAADAFRRAWSPSEEMAFAGEVLTPDEGVRRAMAIAAAGAARPVIIADTQDNPGAGGNSDTTGMLRALVANEAQTRRHRPDRRSRGGGGRP